jgi:small GTP-binding protein
MGNYNNYSFQSLTDIFNQIQALWDTKERKVLFLGLDNAGKTTVLYNLKFTDYTTHTVPTVGFNVETVELTDNITITVWDIGGQDKLRNLWRHYYDGTDAVVFIIDSNDPNRFSDAKFVLTQLLANKNLDNVPVMILCNKQDLPNAKKVSDIFEIMKLDEVLRGRKSYVKGISAKSTKISDFSWLIEATR